MVAMEPVLTVAEQQAKVPQQLWHRGQSDEEQLRQLLEQHHVWTGSKRARELLDNWSTARAKFVKVFPNEYKRALGEMTAAAPAAQAAAPAKSKTKSAAAAK